MRFAAVIGKTTLTDWMGFLPEEWKLASDFLQSSRFCERTCTHSLGRKLSETEWNHRVGSLILRGFWKLFENVIKIMKHL